MLDLTYNMFVHPSRLQQKAEEQRGTTKRQYLACGGHIDIRIITLHSHFVDEIFDIAFKAANGKMADVYVMAESLMKTGTLKVREFVEVKDDKITIALNVDKIDDAAEDKALLLLIEVDEIKNGVLQYFGDPITFNCDDTLCAGITKIPPTKT